MLSSMERSTLRAKRAARYENVRADVFFLKNFNIYFEEEGVTWRNYEIVFSFIGNCMTEVWMFRCSNVTTDAVTGLLTFEEISKGK